MWSIQNRNTHTTQLHIIIIIIQTHYVHARNSEDDTPLINVAALIWKKEVIRVLVKEFCCSPHTKGFQGRTPLALHQACNGGHVDVARKLVTKYDADVNARDN